MDLQPALLWRYFDDLSRIPRGSGNESGVRSYIHRFAEANAFDFVEDEAGNCVVSVPGRGAGLASDPVIIQSHMDMVCVCDQEHADHDFTRDPIRTRVTQWTEKGRTREVLMGTGTTLGADNGMGLVAALAVASDPDVKDRPPLELLFTVEEETGLIGAQKLAPSLLRADLLINLDSEELGEICVSCAGGRDLMADWTVNRGAVPALNVPMVVSVSGLPGGHSGVQIHERRGNAIVSLLRTLLAVPGVERGIGLASLEGGSARNVIPGACTAAIWTSETLAPAIERAFNDPALREAIQSEVDEDVPGSITCGAKRLGVSGLQPPIAPSETLAILSAIAAIPNGVQHWSKVIDGLVETSNNVAVLGTTETNIHLQCSTRSSLDGAIEAFQDEALPGLEASGARVRVGDGYPGWPADPDNPLLRLAEQTFEAILGHAPRITAIHAGLECGVLKGKRPSVQMISFGPDIFGAHTVNERVAIDSVPTFYACLTGLLRDLCTAG